MEKSGKEDGKPGRYGERQREEEIRRRVGEEMGKLERESGESWELAGAMADGEEWGRGESSPEREVELKGKNGGSGGEVEMMATRRSGGGSGGARVAAAAAWGQRRREENG